MIPNLVPRVVCFVTCPAKAGPRAGSECCMACGNACREAYTAGSEPTLLILKILDVNAFVPTTADARELGAS